jgi:hypothetical protein
MSCVDPAERAALGLVAAALAGSVLAVAPGLAPLGYDAFALPKELAAATVLIAAALVAWRVGPGPLRLGAADLLLGAFVALTVASALQPAANPWLASRSLVVTFAAAAAFWCGRALAVRSPGRLQGAIAGVAVVAAMIAIAEAQGWIDGWAPRGTAPGGTFGNRNFMAHTLVLVVPLLCAAGATARRPRLRVTALLGLAVVVHAIALSHCRGAWLAGAAAVIALAGFGLWTCGATDLVRRAAPVAAALGVGIASAVYLPNDLGWRADGHYRASLASIVDHRTGTGRGRLIQYRSTATMAADHPLLGVGSGGWSLAYPRYASAGDPSYRPGASEPVQRLPNADWLGVASERGAPALLVLIGLLLVLGRSAWRARSGWPLALLAAAAVSGLVDANLPRPEHAMVLFTLLGIGAAGTHHACRLRLPPGSSAAAALAIAALTLYLGIAAGRNLAAAGVVAGVEPGHSRAAVIAAFERASALTPHDYRLHLALADHHVSCERAVAHARAALRLHPGSAAARATLARCGAE